MKHTNRTSIRLLYFSILTAIIFYCPIQTNAQVYCSTLYSSGCSLGDNIQNVQISTLNQIGTGCTGGTGYADYTGIVIPMTTGTVYPYTITTDLGLSAYIGWWVDYNNDGDFGDDGEFEGNAGPFGLSFSGNVSITCSAPVGIHRMRLRLVKGSPQSSGTSCTTYLYGETHDYTINIISGGPIGDILSTAYNITTLPFTTVNNNLAINNWCNNTGQASPDVYYKIAAGCTGTMHVSMCGGGTLTDTYLHVQNSSGVDLAFNDDNGPSCFGLLSSLDLAVTAGTDYYIVCEGYSTNQGTFSLEVTLTGAGTTYYADADGDAFGDPGSTIAACVMPTGYVLNDDDCNDAMSAVHPGATELCNGVDDDCDGVTDDGVIETISIVAAGPTTFCSGDNVLLHATYTGTSVQWKKGGVNIPGATTANYYATMPGIYSCLTSSACGTALSAGITVSVYPKPAAFITAGGPTSFCAGESVVLTESPTPGCTFQWYNGAFPIAGATTVNYTATVAGYYRCRVTKTATGCYKNSNTIIVHIVCKEEEDLLQDFAVSIYPNPANQQITVSFSSTASTSALCTILDLTGKIYNQFDLNDQITIDISNYPAGIYFIKLDDGIHSTMEKFVKQ